MRIRLQGVETEVPEKVTVKELVRSLGRGEDGVAVAVALEVVPRAQWGDTRLADGDRVDIIWAVGGG